MATMYKIRNIRTGRDYVVSEDGWANIKNQGWEGRYEVIDKRTAVPTTSSTYIPAEISAAATAAAEALVMGSRIPPPGGEDDADEQDTIQTH